MSYFAGLQIKDKRHKIRCLTVIMHRPSAVWSFCLHAQMFWSSLLLLLLLLLFLLLLFLLLLLTLLSLQEPEGDVELHISSDTLIQTPVRELRAGCGASAAGNQSCCLFPHSQSLHR